MGRVEERFPVTATRAGARERAALAAAAVAVDRTRGAPWGTAEREALLAASLRASRVVASAAELTHDELEETRAWLAEELRAVAPARTILVVEDEDATRVLIGTVLRGAGWVVHETGSAEEGLAALEELEVDVIATDFGLPGLSGLDLLRRVRASGRTMPVVLVTGSESEELSSPAELGLAALVRKPFALDELRDAVASAAG